MWQKFASPRISCLLHITQYMQFYKDCWSWYFNKCISDSIDLERMIFSHRCSYNRLYGKRVTRATCIKSLLTLIIPIITTTCKHEIGQEQPSCLFHIGWTKFDGLKFVKGFFVRKFEMLAHSDHSLVYVMGLVLHIVLHMAEQYLVRTWGGCSAD